MCIKLFHSFGYERQERQVPGVLYGRFERTLCFCAHTGNTVREQLAAVVQKTLEDADIPVIEIRNVPNFERVGFLFERVALLLLLIPAIGIAVLPLVTATGPCLAGAIPRR